MTKSLGPDEDPVDVARRAFAEAAFGVVFLAEFGSGKTCLCQHFLLAFGMDYVADPEKRPVPLLARLAEAQLDECNDPDTWVVAFIHRQLLRYAASASRDQAQQFWTSGRILFILDGFDEMPSAGSVQAIRKCVTFLNRLAERGGPESRIFLTSRAAFFATRAEELRLPRFDSYELNEWGEREWNICLTRAGIAGRASELARVFNVRDLVRKPYFAQLIIDQIQYLSEKLSRNPEGRVIVSDLYASFVSNRLAANFTRFRSTSLSESDFRHMLRSLALRMLCSYTFRATRELISKAVLAESPKPLDETELQTASEDLVTNTLLHRVGDNLYAFSHPSLLEFLAAEALLDATRAQSFGAYGARIFYTEVFGFAAELHSDPELITRILSFLRDASKSIPSPNEVNRSGENVIANLLTLLRVIFQTTSWTNYHSLLYREVLLNFLGWTGGAGLQVRFASAFSIWRCPIDKKTFQLLRTRYNAEQLSLTRRVLWYAFRNFHRQSPEVVAATDIPPDRPEDAFDSSVRQFFNEHVSALESLLSVVLDGGVEPVERGAYWIVVIAAAIALTSAGEIRVVPALLRDFTASEADLRATARLCLENFWNNYPECQSTINGHVTEYLDQHLELTKADRLAMERYQLPVQPGSAS